jgi:RHS repeat-associated protein
VRYNSQGFLDSVTDPEGYTTSFIYDAVGRPLTVYQPDGSTIVFSYDQNGNQTAVITPGEIETQSYAVGGTSVGSWALVRDGNGRIISKSETVSGVVENFVYTYDAVGRLETVTKDGLLVEEYTYDINGTRIFERNALKGISERSFTYSHEDHLLSAGDTTYQYDVDGFLTSKTKGTEVTSYNYSSRGELLSISLPGGRIIEYIHDPLGRRIVKKINGVIVEKYLWSGLTRLLAVYDGTGILKMRFEYADSSMPIAVTMTEVMYYLAYDQVGSFRLVADGAGNVVKEVRYDSFGNVTFDSNSDFETPFGFAGGRYDKDTDLVRFGYRDYDPNTGRWTAKDPILFAGGGTDLYGYCLNNPINWIDPAGLIIGSMTAKIGGRILGQTAQEAAVAGRISDSAVALGIEASGISVNVPNNVGYALDGLQAVGGAQTLGLGSAMAAIGAAPVAVTGVGLLGGIGIGLAFNHAYERFSGQPLGADIYDWIHNPNGWLNRFFDQESPCP